MRGIFTITKMTKLQLQLYVTIWIDLTNVSFTIVLKQANYSVRER